VSLFFSSLLLILLGGVAAAAQPRTPGRAAALFRVLVLSGCLLGLASGLTVLFGAPSVELTLRSMMPLGAWVFGIDTLSALFLVAIFAVGGASALFGVSYMTAERTQRRAGSAHLLTAVLISALALVVVARAVVPFLMAWEVMAITAYLLIAFERERSEVRRAGLLYITATHACTLALFVMFALWGGATGNLTFAALAARAPAVMEQSGWLLGLALLSFGLKAGVIPLHFWLPSAHAAAPSHISALLSGIVIKMGIYGFMRTLVLLGAAPAWFGWLLLLLGALSGVLGVVWALAQHDLKRLLAYHSVENIGIILLGLGAGTLGLTYGHRTVALLGFAGAALHTLNHALFKSLLFLGAGSVMRATGTREIDRMGGLAKRMPATSLAFVAGSVAIVGLPPLNGFVSEWLVFRSLLASSQAADVTRMAILGAAVLGLIGALALACFAKVVGVLYLGEPRDPALADARESGRGMTWPLFALAAACALIGLAPVAAVPAALRVAALLAGVTPTAQMLDDPAALQWTLLASGLVAGMLAAWLAYARVTRARSRPAAETWACGYDAISPRMQYTASSFAAPILLAFGSATGVHAVRPADRFETHPVDPVDRAVGRVWRSVRATAGRIRPIQRGRLSHYLLYVVVTVLALLIYLLAAGGTV
jgi:hydrogenase-4 component B